LCAYVCAFVRSVNELIDCEHRMRPCCRLSFALVYDGTLRPRSGAPRNRVHHRNATTVSDKTAERTVVDCVVCGSAWRRITLSPGGGAPRSPAHIQCHAHTHHAHNAQRHAHARTPTHTNTQIHTHTSTHTHTHRTARGALTRPPGCASRPRRAATATRARP
jgi:hypothetical protein